MAAATAATKPTTDPNCVAAPDCVVIISLHATHVLVIPVTFVFGGVLVTLVALVGAEAGTHFAAMQVARGVPAGGGLSALSAAAHAESA